MANYGQGGYGTDQAYLRFELNNADQAPINILGIYPDNILRNLNQYRPFLAGPYASWLAVKPRFVIDESDELKLIPQPTYTYDELVQASTTPEILFKHETFLPNSANGLPRYSFPYSLTIARFITSKKVRNFFSKTPTWIHLSLIHI